MPGTNAGTGQPLTLRCSKCKKHRDYGRHGSGRTGDGTNLIATGRFRAVTHKSIRQTNRKIQYRCKDCGFVGWTQHIDAERLVRR
jgi:predicted RNA-binding Zn-ribbon protein involved in translation (DUF1610 family)